jgi:Domain of unknown function (DUF6430)
MRFIWDTISSKAYWKYAVFSRAGVASAFSIFGGIWLLVETLDFFKVYSRDDYGSYAFIGFLALSFAISVALKRPIKSIEVSMPARDLTVEVRIGDIFEATGAVMISTNTQFEADVAGGKIAPGSLQGQFAGRYFPGDQVRLQQEIRLGLAKFALGSPPYPIGTTIPISTHGKTFYLTAMAALNAQGTASTTAAEVLDAVDGLWKHVKQAGELQELAVPVVGTGRGRLAVSRKKMIGRIAESFVRASRNGKLSDRLVIVVRPDDAARFQVNLYDIRDHLVQTLHA